LEIITIQTGELYVNTYIVFKEGHKEAVVIDPGGDLEKILDAIQKNGLHITHILLTHGHFDHIGAVSGLKEKTGAAVCIHAEDADMLVSAEKNLSVLTPSPSAAVPADVLLKDGDTIDAAGFSVRVLHTPGHSPGSVCYVIEDCLFSGDTLFYMSVGRTDFPGSDVRLLQKSVGQVLAGLSGDYKVCPGHGESSMLSKEKKRNPFFKEGMAW